MNAEHISFFFGQLVVVRYIHHLTKTSLTRLESFIRLQRWLFDGLVGQLEPTPTSSTSDNSTGNHLPAVGNERQQ